MLCLRGDVAHRLAEEAIELFDAFTRWAFETRPSEAAELDAFSKEHLNVHCPKVAYYRIDHDRNPSGTAPVAVRIWYAFHPKVYLPGNGFLTQGSGSDTRYHKIYPLAMALDNGVRPATLTLKITHYYTDSNGFYNPIAQVIRFPQLPVSSTPPYQPLPFRVGRRAARLDVCNGVSVSLPRILF